MRISDSSSGVCSSDFFTTADADCAARVLAAGGIADLFDGICDIRITRYTPKPDAAAFEIMVAHLGVDPAKSLFVEDMARNLTPAKALGMTTVWLDNGSESGHRDHLPDHVDFHAPDIAHRSEDRRVGKECDSTFRSR